MDEAKTLIDTNKQLKEDYNEPRYLSIYLKMTSIGLTYWGEFNRKPLFNHDERVVCIIKGKERFRLVSSIFKQNMYSGVFEDLDPLDTPINLFETDLEKIKRYKLMKLGNVFEAEVEKG